MATLFILHFRAYQKNISSNEPEVLYPVSINTELIRVLYASKESIIDIKLF